MKFSSIEQIVNDDIFLVLDPFECGRNIHLKLEGFNPGGSIKSSRQIPAAFVRRPVRRLDQARRALFSVS